MRKNLLTRTVALVSFCCCAHAQQVDDTDRMASLSQPDKSTATWTLLGPVAFYRAGRDGTYTIKYQELTRTTIFCAGNTRDSATINVYRSCYNNPDSEIAGFTSGNPSFGIEMSIDSGGHVDKFFANRLRDNFGDMGTMVGATRQWPLASLSRLTVNGGVTVGLWNRTIKTDSRIQKNTYYHDYVTTAVYRPSENFWDSAFERQTIPFVSPALSITDKSGLGVNLSILPVDLRNKRTLADLMLQLTYKLSF